MNHLYRNLYSVNEKEWPHTKPERRNYTQSYLKKSNIQGKLIFHKQISPAILSPTKNQKYPMI